MNNESLKELAYRYFVRQGFNVDFNVKVKSEDGKKQQVDMVISKNSGEKVGVLVVNWGRSIGVNVIRKLSQIVKGGNLKDGILIGKTFSEHSRRFAKDYNIQLLSKSKMQLNMGEL
ncbi:MAG: restriction endonuclease [Candidatus Helarchaeota archaeon]